MSAEEVIIEFSESRRIFLLTEKQSADSMSETAKARLFGIHELINIVHRGWGAALSKLLIQLRIYEIARFRRNQRKERIQAG
jgi:hypothetical protein